MKGRNPFRFLTEMFMVSIWPAGMMLPSLTSAVYFFTFLALGTWWSFCQSFDPLLFSCLCVLMAIFCAGHLIVLYLYQFQFLRDNISIYDTYARLERLPPTGSGVAIHSRIFYSVPLKSPKLVYSVYSM